MYESLTPDQKAHVDHLDKHLKHTPTIKAMVDEHESLKEGQDKINEKLVVMNGRLNEGAEIFKEHKVELNELREEVADVKKDIGALDKKLDGMMSDFNGGLKRLSDDIFTNKFESAIGRNEALSRENEQLKEEKKQADQKAWDIKKIFITAVVGLIMLAVGVALNWK